MAAQDTHEAPALTTPHFSAIPMRSACYPTCLSATRGVDPPVPTPSSLFAGVNTLFSLHLCKWAHYNTSEKLCWTSDKCSLETKAPKLRLRIRVPCALLTQKMWPCQSHWQRIIDAAQINFSYISCLEMLWCTVLYKVVCDFCKIVCEYSIFHRTDFTILDF